MFLSLDSDRVQMTTNTKIIVGFGIIIFLLAVMGSIAIFTVFRMAATSQNIYAHPFTVSNAAKDINIRLLSIQRDMKNVFLLQDREQVTALVSRMERHDREIVEKFHILFDRFLGDSRNVQQLYERVIEWKLVREEIVALVKDGRQEEALRIATTQSAQYVDSLNKSTQGLVAFAAERADAFQREARRQEILAIGTITIFMSVIILISLGIAIYAVRNLRGSQNELARHLYLVDQNVLFCSLDREGHVQDISSALCRLLGLTKEEIIDRLSLIHI